jgi:hypothetical protein
MVARTFILPVRAAQSTSAPWFDSLAPLTWLPIAAGPERTDLPSGQRGARLDQVTYTNTHVWPTGYVGKPGIYGSPNNYCQNSNGAAVDPVNGEVFLVSNGGHGGYMGNETMRLRLRTATPAWERFVESTPPDYLPPSGVNPDTGNEGAFWSLESHTYKALGWHCYLDGPQHTVPVTTGPVFRRPAAAHTSSLPTYSEGKVWFSILNSTNLNGGISSAAKYALNVQSVRDNPALKNWTYGDIRPWEFHGMRTDGGAEDTQAYMMFSGSVLDPATGRIWTPYSAESSAPRRILMMETRGANAGRHQCFNHSTSFQVGPGNCPRIITVTDTTGATKKLLVTLSTKRYNVDVKRYILVIDLSLLESQPITYSGIPSYNCVTQHEVQEPTQLRWHNSEALTATTPRDLPGTWGPGAGWGLIHHAPSKAFFAFNCDQSVDFDRVRRGALRKLSIPYDLQGRYDPVNFQWQWTEVGINTNGGVNVPSTCSPTGFITGGSWSRFNVIPQFDGINDLVIAVNSYNTATSVMKLSPQAI